MESTIIKLLDISVVSSVVICIVLLARLFLKKAPAFTRCLLWGLVGLRLVLPFGIESSLSLIPNSSPVSTYVENIAEQGFSQPDDLPSISTPEYTEPIEPSPVVPSVPSQPQQPQQPQQQTEPKDALWARIAFWVWILGVAAMLCYIVVSYIRMRLKVKDTVVYDERTRIYGGDMMPFVLGVVKPRIYLPSHLSGEQIKCILSHEEAHIKRGDHLIKPLAYMLLAVHWFNPLVWVAYILLCRDIELACDEKVIKAMNVSQRKLYSETLLLCSTKRFRSAVPLAFGEVGIKERVKKVMYYKKPSFWIIVAAVIAIVAVGVFFITNPKDKTDDKDTTSSDISTEQSAEPSGTDTSADDSTSDIGNESEDVSADTSKEESADTSMDTSADVSTDTSADISTDVDTDVSQGSPSQGGSTTVVLPYQSTHETPENLGRSGIDADQHKYWFGKVHPVYVFVWDKEYTTTDDAPLKQAGMKVWLCDRNGNKIDYVYTNKNGLAKFEINVKGWYTICYDGDDKYAPLAPCANIEIHTDYYVDRFATEIRSVTIMRDIYLYDRTRFFPFTIKVYDSITKEPIEGVRIGRSTDPEFAVTDANGSVTTRPLAEIADKGILATTTWRFGFYKDGYDSLQGYAQTQDTELVVYLSPTTYHPYNIKIINQQTREPVQGVQLIINNLGDNSVIYTEFSGADGIVSGMKSSQDMNRSVDVDLFYQIDVLTPYGDYVKTRRAISLNKEQTDYVVYLSIDKNRQSMFFHLEDSYYYK